MTVDEPPPSVADVFSRHRLELLRLAVLLVDDRATAEDVVQDAFIGLHRRWPGLRDKRSAHAYARAAVVNGARSVLRRRAVARRLGGSLHEPAVWSAEAAAMFGEERREVMAALGRLPARRREALVLRYYLDLPDDEIAAVMGIGLTSVRSTVARALQTLARLLGEEAP